MISDQDGSPDHAFLATNGKVTEDKSKFQRGASIQIQGER